ncbi:hypothetical protein PTSG_07619 [Salpingoeca rosetta]|uniref:Uncharacterized protein n=1 Tax=Salpingoeca rosetta (strain ATCC 50818 / BSB-021) TaxID=946362 RepID=F2UHA3_SALR5|nr:uncharacterized protein PTSG_07619 [Salpingoeca rosetta]EGD76502.1 hypothetical protein PTSG_07619 [Salpingoeca rosetta]|eukprot:XP_004991416.1 hypothetical protein PTSG_07619 [Salpingoeca rosetta]
MLSFFSRRNRSHNRGKSSKNSSHSSTSSDGDDGRGRQKAAPPSKQGWRKRGKSRRKGKQQNGKALEDKTHEHSQLLEEHTYLAILPCGTARDDNDEGEAEVFADDLRADGGYMTVQPQPEGDTSEEVTHNNRWGTAFGADDDHAAGVFPVADDEDDEDNTSSCCELLSRHRPHHHHNNNNNSDDDNDDDTVSLDWCYEDLRRHGSPQDIDNSHALCASEDCDVGPARTGVHSSTPSRPCGSMKRIRDPAVDAMHQRQGSKTLVLHERCRQTHNPDANDTSSAPPGASTTTPHTPAAPTTLPSASTDTTTDTSDAPMPSSSSPSSAAVETTAANGEASPSTRRRRISFRWSPRLSRRFRRHTRRHTTGGINEQQVVVVDEEEEEEKEEAGKNNGKEKDKGVEEGFEHGGDAGDGSNVDSHDGHNGDASDDGVPQKMQQERGSRVDAEGGVGVREPHNRGGSFRFWQSWRSSKHPQQQRQQQSDGVESTTGTAATHSTGSQHRRRWSESAAAQLIHHTMTLGGSNNSSSSSRKTSHDSAFKPRLEPIDEETSRRRYDTQAVDLTHLLELRRTTRRPRHSQDVVIKMSAYSTGDDNPIIAGKHVLPEDAANATKPPEMRPVYATGDDVPTRLLNTRLSQREHENYLAARLFSNPYTASIRDRMHFVKEHPVSADPVESQGRVDALSSALQTQADTIDRYRSAFEALMDSQPKSRRSTNTSRTGSSTSLTKTTSSLRGLRRRFSSRRHRASQKRHHRSRSVFRRRPDTRSNSSQEKEIVL